MPGAKLPDYSGDKGSVSTLDPASLSKPRRSRWLPWVVGTGVVGSMAVGWVLYTRYRGTVAEPLAVPIYTVERSTVELSVTAGGNLMLGGQQTLKSPESEATVDQVLVGIRSEVVMGQPLVVLRDRTVEVGLRSQQVDIEKALLDLARSREKVSEVQQRVAAAVEQYQESQDLLAQGFISEDELRQDEERLEDARSAFKDAQVLVTKAELDLQNAQEQLAVLQQTLRDRVITAPMDGIVLAIAVDGGEAIKTETPLLTLGDPTQEVVNLQLSTLDAAKVSINQLARITAIGPDAQAYPGRVVALSPQAVAPEGGGGFGQSQEGQSRVNAQVRLDTPSQTLIPGSFVNVEIVTEQRQNVMVIPPESVQREAGQPFVWVRNRRGEAEPKNIVLGLQGLDRLEVISGLSLGDQVALVPPILTITPGTPLADPEAEIFPEDADQDAGNEDDGGGTD